MAIHRHKKDLQILIMLAFALVRCNPSATTTEADAAKDSDLFPEELVSFVPHENNPVFSGTVKDTWDEGIRERGYILKEHDGYHLWYTGFRRKDHNMMMLGYATSPDGIEWTRYEGNPVFTGSWVEDMMVLKHD